MEARFYLLAIVVADGEARVGRALRDTLRAGSPLVVAADGGALKAEQLGLRPDIVVGDGDSLPPDRASRLRGDGIEVRVHAVDKDESDTELAIREALLRGATSIVLTAALRGSRVEHSLANILLLTMPELDGVDAALVDGPSTVRVMGVSGPATLHITGARGDYVSLLALSERVEGVATSGLRFPLRDETLTQGPARGLSNELLETEASVTTRAGRLAVIHTSRHELDSDG
ncbi:MAG TPA: thiamine diphosphokinase [Vicinamibacterales bacterium]|nr:thiamine diphosphokinase [Vicinamibacterales bacterium]